MEAVAKTYAEAAWRPRPREPPVTTTTLPLREKSEGKSCRSVSDMMMSCLYGDCDVDGKAKSDGLWREPGWFSSTLGRRITGRAGIGDRRMGRFAGDRTSVLAGHLAANDAEPRLCNHAKSGIAA